MSQRCYSFYKNGLYIRKYVDIAPIEVTKMKWHDQHLFWASWSTSQWKLQEISFPSLISFGPSFLYISHCYSDYSPTVTSQITNFLCLISSTWLTLGLFYQHIQLLQHQVSGYACNIHIHLPSSASPPFDYLRAVISSESLQSGYTV